MAKIPITEIRDQSVKPLCNPVTLLYFCFCWSFWPTASVLISVRGIVCVAWPIVSFSSHRPRLEKYRVSHSFWVARQFAKNKMKLTIKGKHNAFAPHGTASFSFSRFRSRLGYGYCMGYSLCKMADFQNCPISLTFGVFSSGFLYRTTLLLL